MAKTGSISKYEKIFQDNLSELDLRTYLRQEYDFNHQERESAFGNLGNLFEAAARQAADNSELILKLDAICLSGEYDAVERNEGLDPKTREARLKTLNEAMLDNLYAQEDVHFLKNSPEEYAERIKQAYGPHRQVKFPPSGDRARKYADTQIKRTARLDAGFRSPGESEFFRKRQLALKSLRDHYIDMQCKALGLATPKKELDNEKSRGSELEL